MITGNGTENDPYIVNTYTDLVTTAAEAGKFVRIGDNINITDEFPEGDMPQLIVNAEIDGRNKIISNWYCTTDQDMIVINDNTSDNTARIKDLSFFNILATLSTKAFIKIGTRLSNYIFNSCKFKGIINGSFATAIGITGADRVRVFSVCSFDMLCKGAFATFSKTDLRNCYIRLERTNESMSPIFYSSNISNCYVEAYMTTGKLTDTYDGYSRQNNSALEIHTEQSETIKGGNMELSIFNSTYAPNYYASQISGDLIAGVTNGNWLNEAYLSSIGFNAG